MDLLTLFQETKRKKTHKQKYDLSKYFHHIVDDAKKLYARKKIRTGLFLGLLISITKPNK